MSDRELAQTARELRALQTKAIIFESAIALFREKDYTKVTISEITRAAGVAKGTFYLYYESKEAIMAEQFARMDAYYGEIVSRLPPEPVDRQLLYFLCNLCSYCQDVCGLNVMKTLYIHQISIELQSKFLSNKDRPFYKIMTNFVREGFQKGVFRSAFSEAELLEILIRAVHGLIYDWCLYNGEFDLKDEAEHYIRYTIEFVKN